MLSVAYPQTPSVIAPAPTVSAQMMSVAATPTTIAPAEPELVTQPCPTKGGNTAPAAAVKGNKRQRVTGKTPVPLECPDPSAMPGQEAMAVCEEKMPETGTWLIVAKAVRQHLKNHETSMHCGSDALPALNAKLADIIREAIARAHANGRKTLKGCDF